MKAAEATTPDTTESLGLLPTPGPFDGLTEGRHVYYEGEAGHYAAIVAKVVDKAQGIVVLMAIGHDGVPFFPGTCAHDEGSIGTGFTQGRWRWMFSGQGPHMLQPGAADPKYNK